MPTVLLGLLLSVAAATAVATGATANDVINVAPGVDLIPGSFVPNQQPDGNTVVFHAHGGLVVMDTGRHATHSQKIIDYAHAASLPIVAIINSHWHLDHIGGNGRIRSAFPDAQVYASSALDGALGGFLADYRKYLVDAIAKTTGAARQPLLDDLAIIDAAPSLAPDHVIVASASERIDGRELSLHLEKNSVTAGDVWVFDPQSKTLAAGDLITLPVPFFDTACPARWKSALNTLGRVDFKMVIPGHGAPMQRKQFEIYRTAYFNLLACAASTRDKQECIDGWTSDASTLIAAQDRDFSKALMAYYIDSALRGDPAKTGKWCGA